MATRCIKYSVITMLIMYETCPRCSYMMDAQSTSEERCRMKFDQKQKAKDIFAQAFLDRNNIPAFLFYDIAYGMWGGPQDKPKRCSLVNNKYFLFTDTQRSSQWKEARNKRATASAFGTILGVGYDTVEEWNARMVSGTDKKFARPTQMLMDQGTKDEEKVRNWLEEDLNRRYLEANGPRKEPLVIDGCEVPSDKRITIKEIGLAVPIFDVRLGASVDGIVCLDGIETDEIIEIKCTRRKIRRELREYIAEESRGTQFTSTYSHHILPAHYAQMQGCMAITDTKLCHYAVFSWETKQVISVGVHFNEKYWNHLRSTLTDNFEKIMPEIIERYQHVHRSDIQPGRLECTQVIEWKLAQETARKGIVPSDSDTLPDQVCLIDDVEDLLDGARMMRKLTLQTVD